MGIVVGALESTTGRKATPGMLNITALKDIME